MHFVLVLKESVAAKDLAPRKSRRGCFHAMLEDDGVGQVDDVVSVPWSGERVGRFLHPHRARDLIAVAKELNGGRAKGSLMAGILSVLFWLSQGLTD